MCSRNLPGRRFRKPPYYECSATITSLPQSGGKWLQLTLLQKMVNPTFFGHPECPTFSKARSSGGRTQIRSLPSGTRGVTEPL